MIAHAYDDLDATSKNTELSDEEILHGTGKGAPKGVIEANPKAAAMWKGIVNALVRIIGTGNTENYWRRHRVVKTIHSGGPYIKPLSMKTLSAQTREQMRQNHAATITRNSRCPCGSGKRFKRCCFTPPE